MRVLVCGGRGFTDVPRLWRMLDDIHNRKGIHLMVEGASDDVTGPYVGADYWAHQWALARNISTSRQHARWVEQGNAAGPIRNEQMLEIHKPELVIAFPGGRGTRSMVSIATRAGVPVQLVEC